MNEDYRRAYMVNAITSHEYEEFGPVIYFRTVFEKAWESALTVVKKRCEVI